MVLVRHAIAVVCGLIAGGAVVGAIESVSSLLHPMPEGIQIDDAEGMRQWIKTLPVNAFLIVLLAWAVGSTTGAYVARRLAPHRGSIPAWIVVGLLTAATAFNLIMLPHPIWMGPAGIAACLLFGALGAVLAAPSCYTVQCARTIAAPIDKVFQTLANVESFSQAVTHITNIEFLTEQRSGVGTRFRETRMMNGKEATTELEVTEYFENDRIRLIAHAGGTTWDTQFTVQQRDDLVAMNMTMDARPHRLMAKLVTPMILSTVSQCVEQDMDAVKAYCERQA